MSVIADFQVSSLSPSKVSANTTAAQYFPRLLGTSIGVQSVAPSATSAAGQLSVPGLGILGSRNFRVFVGGNATVNGASTNVTILVRANTGTIATPVYTTIASTSTIAVNPQVDPSSVGFNFVIDLFGASASGVVGGYYRAMSGNTLQNSSPKVLDNALSGISFLNVIPFGLVVSATFSVADATNSANLTQFQIVGG